MPLLVHRSPLFFCRVIVISVLKVNVQLIGRGPIVLEKHFHDNHSLGLTVNAEDNSAICTHWFCMRERERALQVGKGKSQHFRRVKKTLPETSWMISQAVKLFLNEQL